jgi:uncharacterized protein YcbK (DUF882 family)
LQKKQTDDILRLFKGVFFLQLREDIPNFSWAEVVSGFEPDARFWDHMKKLQALRDWWDAPFKVTSGYRSEKHNEVIGGSKPSLPIAIDFLADKADEIGFDGIGLYDVFIHLDLRGKKARWNNRTK